MPKCLQLLNGPPSFISTSVEQVRFHERLATSTKLTEGVQRLRNTLLEILHRLPFTPPDPTEPYAVQIVETLRELIKVENEDNAVLCIKIVMDFQRHHIKVLADYVQPYLSLIHDIFESTDQIIKETLGSQTEALPTTATPSNGVHVSNSPRPGSPAVHAPDSAPNSQQARTLLKGTRSFKVLAECPIAMVSIFQVYREIVTAQVQKFVPSIKKVLLAQAPAQEKAHSEAAAQGTIHFDVAKDIKNRSIFGDLVIAQVKTMSFMAYILLMYRTHMSDFIQHIPGIVVRLLRDCPKERCGTRKELLVAIRHIINFNFRRIFLDRIKDLLDERTLLGTGLTVHDSLKPTAYSTIADLIHHVRDVLSIDQIRATVRVYKQNMMGTSPGTSFQTMSGKLLLSMADRIAKLEDKREARYFLISILDTIGDKFAAMNRQYPNAVKVSAKHDRQASDVTAADFLAISDNPPEWDEIDIFSAAPIKTNTPRERAMDPVSDNKFLFKNIVLGLKSVFYCLRSCNPDNLVKPELAPLNWQEVACGFSAEEVQVLIKLFHEGTTMFQYYECEKPPSESKMSPADVLASHHPMCSKEEKDLLDSFATVFHHVDPATFHEIFHSEIPHIYRMMFSHPALLQVPQFLLASEATSPSFAGMLLQFLMSQIKDVGSSDVDKATILLRLFKLSFMAVTLFSQHNEAVLLPHVNKLVTNSIRLSTTAETPMQYFYLLRSLFRSIGGGRFEHLYHEILPLLEMLLEVLNDLIGAARNTHEQDLYVELSLTVPARLSNLLPHLSYLMKPLVLALRAGSELVSQGLRTLELCVDNLTADYLDPIMAPVIDDLMIALWDHLKPSPYSHFHAHTTMRILGKLGGRNRKFLEGPPALHYERHSDGPASIDLGLIGSSTTWNCCADIGSEVALATIQSTTPRAPGEMPNHLFHKTRAFKLITAQVKLLLGHSKLPQDFPQLVRLAANDIAQGDSKSVLAIQPPNGREQSAVKKEQQQKLLKDLLKGCVVATSIPELADEATSFIADVCRHFAILEVGQALLDAKLQRERLNFSLNVGEWPSEIDHRVLIDVIAESLSSEAAPIRLSAQQVLIDFRDAAITIFGGKADVVKLPIFGHLLSNLCHRCYKEEWFTKSGGALGINIIATKLDLGTAWFADRQLEICRALMYAAKDLPEDLPQSTRVQALETLKIILRDCNKSLMSEEVREPSAKLQGILAFLVLELAHPCRHVRAATQEALSIFAEIAGVLVSELVDPVKDRLLNHVFNKPLRGLAFPTQIGYIDAVAFCLKLQNGILEPSEQTSRFMREASMLADQEPETFTGRPPDQRHLENMTKLKVACLRLLSLALDFPEFGQSPSGRNRPRVLATFFKSLYSKQPEVVEAANESLRNTVDRDQKLPKDILQAGLRPILVSLQEPSRLKIDNLHCLARLLQILKNYFKVEIGSRLLDNSKAIASDDILQKASFSLIEQHENITVVAAVLHIFHLLPPSAHMFMEKLIDKVLELEHSLRRTHFSPFRAPLLKYLNRYPAETWEYFGASLASDRQKGCFFAQILADPSGEPVREAVVGKPQPLTSCLIARSTSSGTEEDYDTATINAIYVTDVLCSYPARVRTLLADVAFRNTLLEQGKALEIRLQRDQIGSAMRLAAEQTAERLMRIMTFYLCENSRDLDCLLDVIDGITSNSLRDSPSIYDFIYRHIISPGDVHWWRVVISRSIDIYTSKASPELLKAFVIRNLVCPILNFDVMQNWYTVAGIGKPTELVNRSFVETFQRRMWQPQSQIDVLDHNASPHVDFARIELLQATTILLKYFRGIVQEARKDVIKFAWVFIYEEDMINKYATYVMLTYFVNLYETPLRIVTPIYTTLISAHAAEVRSLATQGLEILAPVIPARLKNDKSTYPLWALYARRTLAEDILNLPQLLAIFHFVARHPILFYEARDHFAQFIITALPKVVQVPSQSMEGKRLTLNLLTLIWTWEKKFVEEETHKPVSSPCNVKRKADGSQLAHGLKHMSFIQVSSLRSTLLKYLFQFIALLPDRYPTLSKRSKDPNLAFDSGGTQSTKQNSIANLQSRSAYQTPNVCKQAMDLFSNFLSPPFWSDLDINAMFPRITENILISDPKADEKPDVATTRIVNTLQLLRVMINVKSDEWVADRTPQLQKLLEKPIQNIRPEVQECLFAVVDEDVTARVPIVQRILDASPKETPEEDSSDSPKAKETKNTEFVTFLSTVATEGLGGSHVLPSVNILTVFSGCRKQEVEQHIIPVAKLLTSYVKELMNTSAAQQNQLTTPHSARPSDGPHGHQSDPNILDPQDQVVIKMIELLVGHLAQLGDHRRSFLTMLTNIIEKSPKTMLCSRIVDIVSHWIFDSQEVYPTLKEKTAVVLRMTTFENRSDPTLFNKFLNIVIRVYEDPQITRSELAIRLESAFLIGTRAPDIPMRNRFMSLFDRHLSRTAGKRLSYLIREQSWEALGDSFWISQVIELLFGSIDMDSGTALSSHDFTIPAAARLFPDHQDPRKHSLMLDEGFETFMERHQRFMVQLKQVRAAQILEPLCDLQHQNPNLAKEIWAVLFPVFWSTLSKDERSDLQNGLVNLTTKQFHERQLDRRPNCIQALLEGIARAENPRINFPHNLVKFLARMYNAWYTAICFMEQSVIEPVVNTPLVRESNLDALAEVYAHLEEADLFYGLWRRRSQFLTTNTALSYEQIGDWDRAQRTYETATFKARTGEISFSQGEYVLWEDHWVFCAQKLQQWDILTDFAKVDNLNDLFLDAVWRSFDRWQGVENIKTLDGIVKGVSDSPTPRRMFFQSFMALLKVHHHIDTDSNFTRMCDEAIQLSIRKWHQLPTRITNAHIPILQNFQQLVELHDAKVICTSLSSTNQSNLEIKAPELKLLLTTWRDRLPNFWDDIVAWQDLVTWRRHIFQLVNEKYLSVVPQQQNNASGNSYAYRGYHETAWTINKFAHVARKHHLPDVCINQLQTIYTLPNIEIQEAFLKLREQAKCHYQNASELQAGLDVINNTNLNYFQPTQKAEFYTLKGMFLAKKKEMNAADEAFGTALFFELKLSKAWAEWARYNEQLFKEQPDDLKKAAAALQCYLEAAGTYKNAKSRKAIGRVLWLLSLDDSEATLAKTFEDYKGDIPIWYWITFIPQLISGLSRQEAKIARTVLVKLAKGYPQALYYHLRTSREDFQQLRRQHDQRTRGAKPAHGSPPQQLSSQPRPDTSGSQGDSSRPGTAPGDSQTAREGEGPTSQPSESQATGSEGQSQFQQQGGQQPSQPQPQQTQQPAVAPQRQLQPWDYLDEVASVLKTAFPLLALSMETMVEQIVRNFRANPDEEAYRLINALLADSMLHISQSPGRFTKATKMPPSTETNIRRFGESVIPAYARKAFEADFLTEVPDMHEYIMRVRKWRDRWEEIVDRRDASAHLESMGHHLSEFKFNKFDEVEIPGQYALHKDKNQDFMRIERLLPDVELSRSAGLCYKTLGIRAHDGTTRSFTIQHPALRNARREERTMQMFRFFNDVLGKRKESRRRRLHFTLPTIVPLTPNMRMIQCDPSYISLQGIYENHCWRKHTSRDEPMLFAINKLRDLQPRTSEQASQIRLQVFEAISSKQVPPSLVVDFFRATYPSFDDFWLFRRQVAYQLAALSFMTFVLHMRDRSPGKMCLSRANGNVWGTELVPSMSPHKPRPQFENNEAVPVRFTPNLQMLLGPLAIEGIFTASVLVIAKSLADPIPTDAAAFSRESSAPASGAAGGISSDPSNPPSDDNNTTQTRSSSSSSTVPDSKLESIMSIFVRDEVLFWYTSNKRPSPSASELREHVRANGELIVKRAFALAKPPTGSLPASQSVIDLVSRSVDPKRLSQMDGAWMPWL